MIQRLQETPFSAALLTGVLMGIAYPPGVLGALAWIGLIPLMLRLEAGLRWRSVVLECVAAWSVTTIIVGYWTLFHPLASVRSASLAGMLALSIASSVPFWMFGFSAGRRTFYFRSSLLVASAILVDFAQFHTQIGFPWLAAGHTQALVFPINQLAAHTGVPGLSVWVLTINLVGLLMLSASARRRRTALLAYAAIVILSVGLGLVQSAQGHRVIGRHRVLAVQPALTPQEWSDVYDVARPLRLVEMSRPHVDDSLDVIIWPETTLPVLSPRDKPSEEYLQLSSFVDTAATPLLAGAIFAARGTGSDEQEFYNSAIVLSPLVGITARYDKRIPVPFAERVPWIDQFPWLRRLGVESGGVSGYAAGRRSGPVEVGGVHIGVLICFESAFGRAARETLRTASPAYFVVLAQDGWWGDSPGYQQHYALTKLRAIETGRAVLQVTVTGITGLILPDGTSTGETEWMEPVARHFDVPVHDTMTPYATLGDWPIWILGLLSVVSGFASEMRVRNRKL